MNKLPLVLAAAWACLAHGAHAVPSTAVSVIGQVGTPGSYDAAALAQVSPQVTRAESYTAAGKTTNDTFTGPTLYGLLQAAGGITLTPGVKNDVLRHYIIATGTDGYKAVISAGEIAPNFGNKPDLVAIRDTLGGLPGADGVARVVADGDKAGGRYVSNLATLDVREAPAQPGTGGGTTSSFTVQGAVTTPRTYTLSALEMLTPYQQTVTYTSAGQQVTDTYTGALLWDVLASANITLTQGVKNDILRKVVTATGSDGYQVDFSLGELSPMFGNEPILVAYSDTNGQIAGGAGFARLVVPGDTAGGRYVSNLASFTIFDPTIVPEPASLVLLFVGLAGATWMHGRGRLPRSGPDEIRRNGSICS